jgi:predicted nucleic acid-binding Zn ribbon protein
MPLYTYECERCIEGGERRTTEIQKPVEERLDVPACDVCRQKMKLIVSLSAPTFPGAASWRG